jgi:hypothetical protein
MDVNEMNGSEDGIVLETTRTQMDHFREADPRCRALELPDGVMLHYTLSQALFFYLRTAVEDGKIVTRVFASDSPYERQKTIIGRVSTPMFEPRANLTHLEKIEKLLYGWVDFVKDAPDSERSFRSFPVENRPE